VLVVCSLREVLGGVSNDAGLIEDYAIIGNCESAALVGRDGSIDWLALPRFDSAACFAALLGEPENGRWQIAPKSDVQITRRYRDRTLIAGADRLRAWLAFSWPSCPDCRRLLCETAFQRRHQIDHRWRSDDLSDRPRRKQPPELVMDDLAGISCPKVSDALREAVQAN
jgi:hypothetical protein